MAAAASAGRAARSRSPDRAGVLEDPIKRGGGSDSMGFLRAFVRGEVKRLWGAVAASADELRHLRRLLKVRHVVCEGMGA